MKFLIIGLGNIGLRHIQGLSKLKSNISFYLFDKKKEYLINYQNEINEIKKNHKVYNISNYDDIFSLKKIDLIIISTTAKGRALILNKLRKFFPDTKIVIEKPICQSIYELNKLKKIQENTYVNHPFRYNKWFIKIKKEFLKDYKGSSFNMVVKAPKLGLGCNACHFIDLFHFFTNLFPTKVIAKKMNWIKSKRIDFDEVDGILEIYFGSKHKLIINSISKGIVNENIVIEGKSKTLKFIIDFDNKICKFNNYNTIPGRLLYQSECSNILFKNIKNNKNITNLKDAIKLFKLTLMSMVNSWNKSFKTNKRKINIT